MRGEYMDQFEKLSEYGNYKVGLHLVEGTQFHPIRLEEPQGAAIKGSVFGAFLALLPFLFLFAVWIIQRVGG
ncbi:MAG: hypothetical protein ABIK28_17015 [Planctomycetota bacterium]